MQARCLNNTALKILVCALCASLWGPLLAQDTADDSSQGKPKVQVRVISQLSRSYGHVTKAYASPVAEFREFVSALRRETKELEDLYDIEYLRFPAKMDDDCFRISLYLHEWSASSGGIIRAHFSARIDYKGERRKLGAFSGKQTRSFTHLKRIQDEDFAQAIVKAGKKFTKTLAPILEAHLLEGNSEIKDK